ncbi:MAG: hypothetical protein H0W69_07350 [Gemmatimonadaceae bacterium]|nr:hypothetical protein [Gemmatimonadaceae bacterium]
MNVSRSRRFAIPAALLVSVTLGACGKKDEPAVNDIPVPAPAAPVALRVADIQTGKAIGADKRVTNGSDEFGMRDTIYVAVTTEGSSAASKLTAKWTYNDAQVVNESSESISPTGTTVTEFHITKASAWPKGKYKVDVSLDGAAAGSKEFEIK